MSVCVDRVSVSLGRGGGLVCFMFREMEILKKAISTSPEVELGHLTALCTVMFSSSLIQEVEIDTE